MDQPPLDGTNADSDSQPLPYLPAGAVGGGAKGAFVAIARSPDEFERCLRDATPAMQWIQAEGLLGEMDAWSAAARSQSQVALDVVMTDPATEYPLLYRLVDVSKVRDVRITIPVREGFLKALRLAAAIQLPVRLLPVQPDRQTLAELIDAVDFYLHDPMVDAPVEFFHSALGWCGGGSTTDLWLALERDPAVFLQLDEAGNPVLPARRPGVTADAFVEDHVARLDRDHAECVTCGWRGFCRGYFKLADPDYSCEGIIAILDQLRDAAGQIASVLGDPGLQPDHGDAATT